MVGGRWGRLPSANLLRQGTPAPPAAGVRTSVQSAWGGQKKKKSFPRRMLRRALTEGGEPLQAKILEAMGEMPKGLELLCEIAAPLGTRFQVLETRQGQSRGATSDDDMEPDKSPEAKWAKLPGHIKSWFQGVWAKVDIKATSLAARVSKTVLHYIDVREGPTSQDDDDEDADDDDDADRDDDDDDDCVFHRSEPTSMPSSGKSSTTTSVMRGTMRKSASSGGARTTT